MAGLSILDADTKKAVFSASIMMTLLLSICLLSRIILWVLFGICAICAIYLTYYMLKNGELKFGGKKKNGKTEAEFKEV
jgi:hypothetical protein